MDSRSDVKAVGMISGGLDSTLAVRIMRAQGVAVTALHFWTGFSFRERPVEAQRAADILQVPLEVIDVSEPYISVVLNPRYGYGSEMNPCVDCRIFLLRQAKAWMEAHGHHFVFTGEVVGQRPKSQMPPSLRTVERESGLEGYLLRPLSAKLLEPTVPELRGWVDREKLYAINGRGRKEQIALAEAFGISDYPQPSGGCCTLIQKVYSRRLNDFLEHEGEATLTPLRVRLMTVGRHFRIRSGRKVVIGRNEAENDRLIASPIEAVCLITLSHPGPVTLIPGRPGADEIKMAARMTAGYSDGRHEPLVCIGVGRERGAVDDVLAVEPMDRDEIRAMMV